MACGRVVVNELDASHIIYNVCRLLDLGGMAGIEMDRVLKGGGMLHPLFKEILRPQIEATCHHRWSTLSNGAKQCIGGCGKIRVPKHLLPMYDGPAYRGRVIVAEEEK